MTNHDLPLVLLSAMYENGGNTTHRFLDGHPQMFVYPFESQLGTRLVTDDLSSQFPVKYRWPVFALDATPAEDYQAIIDEECKVRTRTPLVSKFRHMRFDPSDDMRRERYVAHVARHGRSTGANVTAFFQATFDAWTDLRRSGREKVYVGYSPIIIVDADRILADLESCRIVHVVRNPWSAYADTKKRPVPMSLNAYMRGWTTCQLHALRAKTKWPDRVHLIRVEDVLGNPHGTLSQLASVLGLESSATLGTSSWNGVALEEVYPWGTIRQPTLEANRTAAASLTAQETEEIRLWAAPILGAFDYE